MPEWSRYKVVVMNYDAPDERWPAALKASFEHYVRDGGGFVPVHAADNAFPNWTAFNEMIGVGGWRGRTAAVRALLVRERREAHVGSVARAHRHSRPTRALPDRRPRQQRIR